VLLALLPLSLAGSIDILEVGGVSGTPTSTDGTAAWWNPAGLTAEPGGRVTVDGAYTWGVNTWTRTGARPGSSEIRGASPLPYVGVAWSGPGGLGLGAALAVPYATGGREVSRGANAYYTRDASMLAAYGIVGAAWQPTPRVSFGLSGAAVVSSMSSVVDQDTVPDLHQTLQDMGQESPYTDADLEDPAYAAVVELGPLTDTTWTVGVGARFQLSDQLVLGISGWRGVDVANTGDATLHFGCPPQTDSVGRFGAESRGVCHEQIRARATSRYSLPHRVSAGLAWTAPKGVRIEAMGGWVGWSAQQELVIELRDVGELNPHLEPEIAAQMERDSLKARDLRDGVWGGVDVKARVQPWLVVGGRALYDRSVVPSHAMSPANADFDQWLLSAMVAVDVGPRVRLGVSWTHTLQQTRVVTDSAYAMSLDAASQPAARYQAPAANGTYAGQRDRVALTLGVRF
jgi:long-subunit fatty acid transport protein